MYGLCHVCMVYGALTFLKGSQKNKSGHLCYMYASNHSPLGGGGQGPAQGDGVTGENHTLEACHGVSYQGVYPQRALIGAGDGALQRGSVGPLFLWLARAASRRAAPCRCSG